MQQARLVDGPLYVLRSAQPFFEHSGEPRKLGEHCSGVQRFSTLLTDDEIISIVLFGALMF
jgi:hypothetical protein